MQLFKCQYKIYITADSFPAGFQLLRCTGSYKDDLAVWILLFDQTGSKHHRCQCHGDTFCLLREQLLRHHGPCRTAGSCHEWQLFRYFLHEVLCFLNGTEICSYRYFDHILESQCLKCRADLLRLHIRSELTGYRRCYDCINRSARLHSKNGLEYLTFVNDSAERTTDQTHTTGHTFLLIDLSSSMFIRMNSIHATGFCTGTFLMNDRIIRTGLHASATFDTFLRINVRLSIYHGNSSLRTDLFTWMFQTALTSFGHDHPVLWTGMTGKFNNIDQWRLIIFFLHQTVLHSLGDQGMLGNLSKGKTKCHTKSLSYNRSLQENTFSIRSNLPRYDLIRKLLHLSAVSVFISHAGDLRKNLVTDLSL